MKKTWWLIPCLIVVLVLGAVGCASANGQESGQGIPYPSQQQNTGIWVTGQGEARAIPDIVELRLGVEVQADTVAEAQAQASEAMEQVMEALKANNVAEKDIQTQRFSISPVTRWVEDKQELIGYRVTNIVLVKIREVDKAGVIIDAVAEAGGDFSRIQSISLTVDDPTPYYEEARSKAMEDAKSKATQLANSAGVQLGKPTYISEGTIYWPPYVGDFEGYKGGEVPSTPISPGELKITVNVQVVYGII
jgi:hypothetical protein